MMILLALLIAVVAISLMMTVLVATTRPLRSFDDPIFGAGSTRGAARRLNGPNWMELDRAPPPSAAPHMPHVLESQTPELPPPAPAAARAPEMTDSCTNPNTWGRVRAEVGTLKTMRDGAGSAAG